MREEIISKLNEYKNTLLIKKLELQLRNDFYKYKPTIALLNAIIDAVSEREWLSYKESYPQHFENLYPKICGELRKENSSFEKILLEFELLEDMQQTLGYKYQELYKAMEKYYEIYHGSCDSKELKKSQDIISKYSALFVAKEKEKYKKENNECLQSKFIKYFKLKNNNDLIKKKIIEVRQKEEFKRRYAKRPASIKMTLFIESLAKKYSSNKSEQNCIKESIDNIITSDYNITLSKPSRYDEFLEYQKVKKLINRLNQHYISIDGVEVLNYKHLIEKDNISNKYIWCGTEFTEEEMNSYIKYEKEVSVLNKIKKEIMLEAKKIKVDEKNTNVILNEISKDIPFTDEYYEFDVDKAKKEWSDCDYYDAFIYRVNDNALKAKDFKEFQKDIYEFFMENGLQLLLALFNAWGNCFLGENCFENNYEVLFRILSNFRKLKLFWGENNINLLEFKRVLDLNSVLGYTNEKTIAILGEETIFKLCINLAFTEGNPRRVIKKAEALVNNMNKLNESTVPYIEGENSDYKYSMYDHLEDDVLLSGINTDSCCRVDGYAHNLLGYCCLDKNGFVIKITNKSDDFIAKAAGFRSGNCVYINQLRTIYDERGGYYYGRYPTETAEILATFRQACKDIVNLSQKSEEEIKIDYVFITESYSFESTIEELVPIEISTKVGSFPVDTTSKDWHEFISNNGSYFVGSVRKKDFLFDLGGYRWACVASSKELNSVDDIKITDVPAFYKRKRNQIVHQINPDKKVIEKINKTKALKERTSLDDFIMPCVSNDSEVFVGDNWYLILLDDCIVDSCVLEYDEHAKNEYEVTLQEIKERTKKLIKK